MTHQTKLPAINSLQASQISKVSGLKHFWAKINPLFTYFVESQHYKVNQNDSDSSVDEEADILRKFDEIMLQKE